MTGLASECMSAWLFTKDARGGFNMDIGEIERAVSLKSSMLVQCWSAHLIVVCKMPG